MATPISRVDDAGRTIAGLLTYNPGPGIYSRLERAIQQMPENVRVQELPGLLKRYKEGVPGWELKATDLDSVIAGRDVVPRDDLLARVRETSPVYTHKEVVLTDNPPNRQVWFHDITSPSGDVLSPARYGDMPYYQDEASPLGRGYAHGDTKYADYGQGGADYTEILLAQPGASTAGEYGNHWLGAATQSTDANLDAVAHARFDTHGDALRINELQSDLGIFNRRAREDGANPGPMPFPLEDAWADILIKRLALEAARKGHRAIEVASPRAIADKVGGNIDNYEHFYGKVVPGALERLGRKMGGVVEDSPPAAAAGYNSLAEKIAETFPAGLNENDNLIDAVSHIVRDSPGPGDALRHAVQGLEHAYVMHPSDVGGNADFLYAQIQRALVSRGESAEDAARLASAQMPRILRMAEDNAKRRVAYTRLRALGEDQEQLPKFRQYRAVNPGRRYIMSDEMRRRLIEQGIGASLLAPVVAQEGE